VAAERDMETSTEARIGVCKGFLIMLCNLQGFITFDASRGL
jgi:hypothetical protein